MVAATNVGEESVCVGKAHVGTEVVEDIGEVEMHSDEAEESGGGERIDEEEETCDLENVYEVEASANYHRCKFTFGNKIS